ncbi:MAG: apolipoprotein N-acyltransferase [Myxococcota bacterium]
MGTFWRCTAPLAVASGVALGLSAPPISAWGLGFAAPGLLLAALYAGGPLSPGRAFGVGAIAGVAVNAIALYWAVGLLQDFARFPVIAAVPTALLLWATQAAPFALAAAGTAVLARRGAPAWLVLPAAWTVAFSWTPALFPWRPAASQVPFLPWIQAAELGGEPLLDFLLALAGCAAARAAWPSIPRSRRAVAAAVAVVAVAGPAAYGSVRLPQVRLDRERAPILRIGVVQPNVGIHAKRDRLLWEQHLDRLRRATRTLERQGAELVLWPETAYPYPFPRGRTRDLPGHRSAREGTRTPLLFGAITERSRCERWNSALAMAPDGRVLGVADKVRLLHFGETVPLWHWLPPLRRFFRCPGLTRGERPPVLHLAGTSIGVLNCYEDILGAYAAWVAGLGPELLVNLTNDAWFGDTSEPHLHHQVARLRAVETRRDLVRAVNTGVSGHVLATGEEAARTDTWVTASFVTPARTLRSTTPWVRLGDVVSPAAAGALLGLALALARRGRGRR